MNNCIIGAGQLGSRHLQGLLKVNVKQRVFVVDPSSESLDIARSRANEVEHNNEVKYYTELSQLPKNIDIAIIATNSLAREKVIFELLEKTEVRHLVLEKVLFPEVKAYERVETLIESKNVKTWVNHPRRMFSFYQDLKQEINTASPKALQLHVVGNNWGLGCNGLHFIDLMQYLSGEAITTINCDFLDNQVKASKRSGYIEFTGSLIVQLSGGSQIILSSYDGDTISTSLLLSHSEKRYIIHEGITKNITSVSLDGEVNSKAIVVPFQSNLTTELIEDLICKNLCDLPTYEESAKTHQLFIQELLEFENRRTQKVQTLLKIT